MLNNPRNKSTYTNANLVLEYVLQCGIDVNVSLWVSLFVGSKNYNCVQFWFHYKDFNLVSSLTKLPLQFKWWIERATHRGLAHWCIVLEYRPAGDLLTRGYEIFVWLICFFERNSCFNDDIFTLEPCRSNHITPPTAEILSGKNVRAWVSMFLYSKEINQNHNIKTKKKSWEPFGSCLL